MFLFQDFRMIRAIGILYACFRVSQDFVAPSIGDAPSDEGTSRGAKKLLSLNFVHK